MSATDRLRTEKSFHDRQARQRRAHFTRHPEQLLVDEEWFLDHETWVRPALALLGDVRGRQVLDYGCGHGMAGVLLAKHGACVTAFDLSAWYLEEAGQRAEANGVAQHIHFLQASAEMLPFQDAAFDCVWGSAILHHLDLPRAAAELARVLKPDGVAVFCEPWGENPFLEWARRRLAYPEKERSPDERPLRRRDLNILREHFRQVEARPFQLLGMIRRLCGSNVAPGGLRRPLAFVERCDEALLRNWPALSRFCRYIVLSLRR